MPMKKISNIEQLMRNEQPINWSRGFMTGVFGASLMMAFIDSFNMMGLTRFSYEVYLGSLIRGTPYGTHNWTVGVFANWLVGGVFGLLYAYFFEYQFGRASARVGLLLGFGHAALASVAFFPFFNAIHEQMGSPLYAGFGFFGSGLNPGTPILLLIGNLLFGATVGAFYGPVREDRVMARLFEPGESGLPGEAGVISDTDDQPVRPRRSAA